MKTKQKYDDIDSEDSVEEFQDRIDLTMPKDHDFELYSRLSIPKDSTNTQIKKAYRKASLKVHPDKNPDDPEADSKFQKVNEAYVILSNEEKRKRYDLTGEIDEDGLDDLINKCRFFYKEFSGEDIDSFATNYKNSKDEEEDLAKFYNNFDGDITQILNWIPLSQNSDLERFIKIFNGLIKEEEIEETEAYKETQGKIQLLENEEKEAEEHKIEKKRVKKGKKKGKKAEPSFEEKR
mmetsp:Transcript_450/g.410  ORF Transcript_450/g.410 Transcript_450/m.410 type:complete len:236 (-) Transcript_450:4-711(-)